MIGLHAKSARAKIEAKRAFRMALVLLEILLLDDSGDLHVGHT